MDYQPDRSLELAAAPDSSALGAEPADFTSAETASGRPPALLSRLNLVAPENDLKPLWRHRLAYFPLLFIPWLIFYEFAVWLGPQPGAFETFLPGEVHWPIWQWTELLYVSPYVLVTLAPLIAPTNRGLRRMFIAAWMATIFVGLLFLIVPAIAPFRPFHPHGLLGQMMLSDRALDRNNGAASFPSFHVVWSFLGAMVWAERMPRWRIPWIVWAAAVSASCVLTGMHSFIDILGGSVVFLWVYNYQRVGQWLVQRGALGKESAAASFTHRRRSRLLATLAFAAVLGITLSGLAYGTWFLANLRGASSQPAIPALTTLPPGLQATETSHPPASH